MNKKAIRTANIIDLVVENEVKKTGQYNNYGFILQWDELDEELKNSKIVEYARYNESEYPGAKDMDEDEIISNDDWYSSIESSIEARFPIYF